MENKNTKEGQTLTKMPAQEAFLPFSQQNSCFVWVAMCLAPSDELFKPILASLFSFPRTLFFFFFASFSN